jgi:hypothetical protein
VRLALLPVLALWPAWAFAATGDLAACAAIKDNVVRLACYDALAARPAQGNPQPAAPAAGAETFGKAAQPEPEPETVEARIKGAFEGWQKGQLITLDNGQVWKCVDDQRGVYPDGPANPEVVITKSVFGGYWMEVKSLSRRFRVRRIS